MVLWYNQCVGPDAPQGSKAVKKTRQRPNFVTLFLEQTSFSHAEPDVRARQLICTTILWWHIQLERSPLLLKVVFPIISKFKVQTRYVCETQMFPIMAIFKDWEAHKDRYLGNSRLILLQEVQ